MAKRNEPFGWSEHGIFIRTEKDSGFINLELYDQGTGRTIEERRIEPEFASKLGFILELASIIAKPGRQGKPQGGRNE